MTYTYLNALICGWFIAIVGKNVHMLLCIHILGQLTRQTKLLFLIYYRLCKRANYFCGIAEQYTCQQLHKFIIHHHYKHRLRYVKYQLICKHMYTHGYCITTKQNAVLIIILLIILVHYKLQLIFITQTKPVK